ncbi:two-component sensor histidine kinase [Asanoa ishikariensis]|uniref:histidine kinase n=1 Tax=Asanoa ishikariensis TaxID=137265 RepID=A0A1H3KNT5_9ACTN|nr:HAMP domain-containing sensor histidine kinase [Asanoa ishikariensis]GIF69777.1 two-component sensor histidine kinase [Asanoa ishikariensis]SDY53822.1 two-component system, OmpR family, sensor histidine kinase BaeS [Asanoa ishikariensis]
MPRTLTARAALVGCAVAVVSVLVTALVAIPLAARTVEARTRESLAAEATVVAAALRATPRPAGDQKLLDALRNRDISLFVLRRGVPDQPGLPPAVLEQVTDGSFSGRAVVGGVPSLVEARPINNNGNAVVLTHPRATGIWRAIGQNLWLALLAGLAAGVLAGVLLGSRLARPIRNAALAARRLGGGERGVRVPVEPPQEVESLAHALNGLAEALSTSEGRQRDFLLSVSHELRTPLTTIRGYAEALSDGVIEGDGAARAGRTVLAEAERLDRLVTDLLALARLDAVDFPLTPLPVDLTAIVAETANTWRPRCAAAGVTLVVEAPAFPVPAFTDPGRTRQILDGLLENALRVVPAGAPIVLATRPGSFLEVRDGGPGFTEDDLPLVFERGALRQRYDGVRKGGSGLGLALVHGLVRRLGGQIEAGHAPEGGARFTITLPPQPYEALTFA